MFLYETPLVTGLRFFSCSLLAQQEVARKQMFPRATKQKQARRILLPQHGSSFLYLQAGLWSRKSRHPTPGNFDYPTPTPGRLRPSAVLVT